MTQMRLDDEFSEPYEIKGWFRILTFVEPEEAKRQIEALISAWAHAIVTYVEFEEGDAE